MVRFIGCIILGLAFNWATVCSAGAADVVMRLRGSELQFPGTVVSFDGKTYRVDTKLFGRVNLDIRKYECISGPCSVVTTGPLTTEGSDFKIANSSRVSHNLMPLLVAGYAGTIKADVKHVDRGPGHVETQITSKDGSKLSTIDQRLLSSEETFRALASGKIQIALSTRPKAAIDPNLVPSAVAPVLALDALVVIVSKQNRLSAISIDQLAKVISGGITNWAQLGQAPGLISVYAPDSKSTTFDTLKAVLLDPANAEIVAGAKRIASDQELSEAVAIDRRAIGITSLAYKDPAKPIAISTACDITYSPTIFNMKVAEYPLTRSIFLYTTSAPRVQHANRFIEFSLTGKAQKIVATAGFVDQSIGFLPFNKQGDRIVRSLDPSGDSFNLDLLRTFIAEVGQSSRMSISFRFREASFALDPASRQNINRAAAFLSRAELRNTDVQLLGFSDAAGSFERNRELSTVRARQVKQALLDAAKGRIDEARLQPRGYGELIPIGCNNDALDRAKNRRVEVWIRASAVPAQTNENAAPDDQNVAKNPTAATTPIKSVLDKRRQEQEQEIERAFRAFLKSREGRSN